MRRSFGQTRWLFGVAGFGVSRASQLPRNQPKALSAGQRVSSAPAPAGQRVCTGRGSIEGQLERDHGAGRVADDVSPLDPQVTHQQPAVPSVVAHADPARHAAARAKPARW